MDQMQKLMLTNDHLIRENLRLSEENSRLILEKFKRFNNEECWIFQDDDEDHLESLVCPVVISASKLSELIKK